MTEVLTQDEINQLLAAINADDPKNASEKIQLNPVIFFKRWIEIACNSGELSIDYSSFDFLKSKEMPDEVVEKAFAAFQNRRDELARIHTLSISGNLLSVVIPFLDVGNIRELNIRENMAELPVWIRSANSLRSLSVVNSEITAIPDWIGDLQSLTELSLDSNDSFQSLPESIGNLQFLKKLSLTENKNLKTLPHTIGNLKKLEVLNLRYSSIGQLPDSVINLSALKYVDIIKTNIHSVPEFFYSLEKFFDNKQIEIIPQSGSISYRGFVNSYYTLVETVSRFSVKATRKGLLALEDDLNYFAGDDFFSKGLRLILDGTDNNIIRDILTILKEREHDFYRKKLMEIAMEGILGIQTAVPLYRIIILLNSMVDIENNPVDTAYAKYFAGNKEAFSNIDFKMAIQPEAEREEITFIKRAVKLNEMARREGLLVLEKELDHDRIAARDVFEYGLPLVIDGYEKKYIDTVLDKLIEHETDPVQKNIAYAKKDAVLSIQVLENTRILAIKLCAYFDKYIVRVVEEELIKW